MTVTVMVNRRERVRAATVQEIKDVARRQLVAEGPTAVSLRAIAREMGMTAPALYRYFPSFDHLVRSLVGDLFGEVCTALEDARDLMPAGDAGGRLIAVCRTFRAWSVGHRAEFGLLFGTPMPGSGGDLPSTAQAGGARFGEIFFELFADVWRQQPFPVPTADELDPGMVRELTAYLRAVGDVLPVGVAYTILNCWMRLYGLVSLEVFSHLRFALDDAEPFFEQQLRELASQLGIAPVRISERFQPIS
jgi:AcrR family transcriptional regulator